MAVALALAASTSLLASPMEASAELVKDKYGRCDFARKGNLNNAMLGVDKPRHKSFLSLAPRWHLTILSWVDASI